MENSANRPTSPHLQVYRLPLTGIISITHRMTGVMLLAGLLLVSYMLIALASGEEAYALMQVIMNLWLVKLIGWGFIYALFFHLCHGVRHLIWDSGFSFEAKTLNNYALMELAASLMLTIITFIWGCYGL